jgi:hypothetical protein
MPDGGAVWARISQLDRIRDTGAPDVTSALDVEGFSETIASVARSVQVGLAKLRPREVRVEFGVELAAKTGRVISVLAEAGATATIKVELTWGKDPDPDPDPDQ